MIFAQCNRRQAANIVLEALGSMAARPSARGSLPARSEILAPNGFWRTIERNAPEVFKLAIALNLTGRIGMPEKVRPHRVYFEGGSRSSGTNLIIDGALNRSV